MSPQSLFLTITHKIYCYAAGECSCSCARDQVRAVISGVEWCVEWSPVYDRGMTFSPR